jgi:hypothetical protein
MRRYFFNVRDGANLIDKEGTVLSDVAEAREQAVVAAGEAIRDMGSKFWAGEVWEMNVTDESGATVCALTSVYVGPAHGRRNPSKEALVIATPARASVAVKAGQFSK